MRSHLHYGAMCANTVCNDLLLRGFEVFREASVCSFDLIAYKHGEFLRIECKAACGASKKITKSTVTAITESTCDARKFDVLALVSKEGKIWYKHSAFHVHNKSSLELAGPDYWDPRTTQKNLDTLAERIK